MANLYELAEFLVASWKLGTENGDRMPTSHGVLDAALFRLKDRMPAHLSELLTFGDTRVGFRCHELPQVLYCAQANLLTSEPNPTYLTTEIQISDETACALLYRRSLEPIEAEKFGIALAAEIKKITDEINKSSAAA